MNSLTEPAVSPSERSLGAMEKLFYLFNQKHPNHFAIIGEVTGPTRIDQWQNGLDQVANRSPLVWSRIELDSNGVRVFRPAPPRSIPLKVALYDASLWTAEVAMQIAEPFNELQPPLLRATLLHSSTRSIIILVAHHSIGDGLSLTFLLGDLLRAMAGQEMVRSQESEAVERLVARRYGPTLAPVSAPAAQKTPAATRQPKEVRRPDGSAPHVQALRLTSERRATCGPAHVPNAHPSSRLWSRPTWERLLVWLRKCARSPCASCRPSICADVFSITATTLPYV
jgi:hypothetical protein